MYVPAELFLYHYVPFFGTLAVQQLEASTYCGLSCYLDCLELIVTLYYAIIHSEY